MDSSLVDLDTDDQMTLCVFWVASRLFGVNINDVKEIYKEIDITPTYHAPSSVMGYINIRGLIHLVIDIRQWFGFEPAVLNETSKVLLFKTSVGEAFGVLVDSVDDFALISSRSIIDRRKKMLYEEQSESDRRNSSVALCYGVCELGDTLMMILNARAILPAVEASVDII